MKNFCDELKNATIYDVLSANKSNVNTNETLNTTSREQHETARHRIWTTQKAKEYYTICEKMSVSENKPTIDYLFEHGKCGEICRNGNVYNFVVNITLPILKIWGNRLFRLKIVFYILSEN